MYVGMCVYIFMCIYIHIYARIYIVRIACVAIAGGDRAQLRNERSDRMFRAFDAYLDESADHFGVEELAMRKV